MKRPFNVFFYATPQQSRRNFLCDAVCPFGIHFTLFQWSPNGQKV